MKELKLYSKLAGEKVICHACAHNCKIREGETGICGVNINEAGILKSQVYGRAIAMHVDPIEKKPLYHFFPGSLSFSIATVGCNMHCQNCQNSDISQMPVDQGGIEGSKFGPNLVVMSTINQQCRSISYTYTEPAVFWDYAYDTSILAKENGIRTVFVTNGYFSEESLKTMIPFMDAANVDLKFFKDATYKSVCGAKLKPVLDAIQWMKELGVWVEVTTLLIPDLNDSDKELTDIAKFIHDLDPGIPWHISRFHPTYKMTDKSLTPIETIRKARQIGLDSGLRYVYVGNVPDREGSDTVCHRCGKTLIQREGFSVQKMDLTGGKCPSCQSVIDGIWE